MANKTKVVMFGAGLVGREVLPKLGNHIQVLAFADNDPNKHGSLTFGIPVIDPSGIQDHAYDLILITSTSIADIYDQLIGLGVGKDKIVIMNDAEAGAPEFPWDAVLFLIAIITCMLGLIAYLTL